jgi:uncharacterized protein
MAGKVPPKSKKKKILMKNKLKADSVIALKSHDQARVDVLRYLISLIDKKELQLPPGQMNDAEEIAVLRKELKNKEESRDLFMKGMRDDLVKGVDYEIAIVKEYLPVEMSESELQKIVDEAVAEVGKNFGGVMKLVMTKVAGRVGGERIASLVKERL